jgi:hypothetical protein
MALTWLRATATNIRAANALGPLVTSDGSKRPSTNTAERLRENGSDRASIFQSPSSSADHQSHTAMMTLNGTAHTADWESRYYHVDQILDRPGPRTDPSFLAGEEVRQTSPTLFNRHLLMRS